MAKSCAVFTIVKISWWRTSLAFSSPKKMVRVISLAYPLCMVPKSKSTHSFFSNFLSPGTPCGSAAWSPNNTIVSKLIEVMPNFFISYSILATTSNSLIPSLKLLIPISTALSAYVPESFNFWIASASFLNRKSLITGVKLSVHWMVGISFFKFSTVCNVIKFFSTAHLVGNSKCSWMAEVKIAHGFSWSW